MAIFKKSFRFKRDRLEYDFKLKKCFPWWWLLLLLLPLVLLIPFKKEVRVKVVDKAGTPVASAQVQMVYKEHTIFKKGKKPFDEVIHYDLQETDADGMASFGKMSGTVYSLLFHGKEKIYFSAKADDGRSGSRSVRFHPFMENPVVITIGYPQFTLQCRSIGEDIPIPGAKVNLHLSNGKDVSLVTDSDGKASIEYEGPSIVINRLEASATGYEDKVETDILCSDWDKKVYVVGMYYRIETVDIVLCIDGTGSMSSSMEAVKDGAANLYSNLRDYCSKYGKLVGSFRIRLLCFGDYGSDGDEAMFTTDFFKMPGEERRFKAALDNLEYPDGGDSPESGLEALYLAINSPWSPDMGGRRSQLVVMWTDAEAHDIKTVGEENPLYPSGVPDNLNGLRKMWEKGAVGPKGEQIRRLLLLAPKEKPWKSIRKNWSGVYYKEFDGESYFDLDSMLESLAQAM